MLVFERAVEALRKGTYDLVVIKGDARGVIRHLPLECVDLTVTDPPYASLERHRAVGTTTRLQAWFPVLKNEDLSLFFNSLYLVHRQHTHAYVLCDAETEAVLLTGRNPYDPATVGTSQVAVDVCRRIVPSWRAWPSLTWVKVKRGSQESEVGEDAVAIGNGYHWRRSTERILFLEKGKHNLNSKRWPDVLFAPRVRGGYPTEKPPALLEKLLLNSSRPGEIVFDPFAGSGNVGRVALEHGRRALLVDCEDRATDAIARWAPTAKTWWFDAK